MDMKRFFTIALLASAALTAGAQSVGDAYLYSQNQYSGTARSVGMGNAMTAVGGDLGSIVFNPAGSAVAGYSQFSITPDITISSINAMGTPLSGSTEPYGFEDRNVTAVTRMSLPNVGATMHIRTGRRSGLKGWTFGFIVQGTNNFLQEIYASGSNYDTSYAGYVASLAEGTQNSEFAAANVYNSNLPREAIVGYLSDMISTYGGYTDRYLGVTEREADGVVSVASGLNQKYGMLRTGTKYDIIMNTGFNFSDRFFLGFNLGITQMNVTNDEYWFEEAMDPSKFAIRFRNQDGTYTETYFDNFRFRRSYESDGAGVYAKAGFIAVPFQGLRIGAAVQTPTVVGVHESFAFDNRTRFTSTDPGYEKSEEENWAYNLKTPLRFNAGLAYTFDKIGLVSADYELCDYSGMRVRSTPYYIDDYTDLNGSITGTMGISHMIRVGGELRPMPEFAIRVGYNLTTSPERDDAGKYIRANRENVSFGLGFDSPGSFFADLGFRMHFLPDDYFLVYPDYIFDASGAVSGYSPEIRSKQGLYDILLTLGWRF